MLQKRADWLARSPPIPQLGALYGIIRAPESTTSELRSRETICRSA
jgi:hypothetical protein